VFALRRRGVGVVVVVVVVVFVVVVVVVVVFVFVVALVTSGCGVGCRQVDRSTGRSRPHRVQKWVGVRAGAYLDVASQGLAVVGV
jgi:hypothetical protein